MREEYPERRTRRRYTRPRYEDERRVYREREEPYYMEERRGRVYERGPYRDSYYEPRYGMLLFGNAS